MASRYREQSSNLTSEPNPRSYGTIPPNSDGPPSYSPLPAAPEPASTPGLTPNPTYGPFQGRTPIVISRGLAFCFAIILIQTVLIICRSDALGRLIDLDSATLRESRERSALAAERAKLDQQREKWVQEKVNWEQERINWEHERVELEQEKMKLERERIQWKQEGMKWEQERVKLEQERLELELERHECEQEWLELERERVKLEWERVQWEQEGMKWEQDRVTWDQERQEWELERLEWKKERFEWGQERLEWEHDKLEWEREREKSEREREKSEQEREKMRRERELWEKAKEDRVPLGAFWDVVRPAPACHAYGKREYWATLQNVPEGWTATDACMNTPVEIEGVTVRRPHRCESVDGSPYVHGYWMVDWDQPDCRPWWRNYQDAGCTSYKSGARRIEGELVGLIGRPEQDWRLMCASTPLIWNYITYTSPTHCEERGGTKFGMWDVPDDSCL